VSTTDPPSLHSSSIASDQFDDVAYSPVLLPNHGAGTGRGARLEILEATEPPLDTPLPPTSIGPCMAWGRVPMHTGTQLPLHRQLPTSTRPCMAWDRVPMQMTPPRCRARPRLVLGLHPSPSRLLRRLSHCL
jgi:hypothetical protein